MVKIKRIYDPPAPADGYRVLVDRLWPRGLGKDNAHVDEWMAGISPTRALRAWFAHDPEKWKDSRVRYRKEIEASENLEKLRDLAARAKNGTVTLLFATRDRERNNAVVLKEILEELS